MTAQFPEKLKYKGRTYEMDSEPLACYLKSHYINIPNDLSISACWRGYIGRWKISHKKFYLVSLELYSLKYLDKDYLYKLFPDYAGKPYFCDWFTGEVHYHYGKLKKYVHMGYMSEYEHHAVLYFENGKLVYNLSDEITIAKI